MNDNTLNNNNQNSGTYHATTNLNTAIENPQVNINNVVDVNIQNVPNNDIIYSNNISSNTDVNANVVNNNVPVNGNTFVPNGNNNNIASNIDNNVSSAYDSVSDNTVYEPTATVTKKENSKNKITIPKELKVMLFIVFLLMIFIASIPSIYDFFENLGLVITG